LRLPEKVEAENVVERESKVRRRSISIQGTSKGGKKRKKSIDERRGKSKSKRLRDLKTSSVHTDFSGKNTELPLHLEEVLE
jgi:hypothetical protein